MKYYPEPVHPQAPTIIVNGNYYSLDQAKLFNEINRVSKELVSNLNNSSYQQRVWQLSQSLCERKIVPLANKFPYWCNNPVTVREDLFMASKALVTDTEIDQFIGLIFILNKMFDSVFGSLILRLKEDWYEYPSAYTLSIAEPGSNKSR